VCVCVCDFQSVVNGVFGIFFNDFAFAHYCFAVLFCNGMGMGINNRNPVAMGIGLKHGNGKEC